MRAMAESATQTITIAASPEHCFAVATDFPRYPEWAKDIKEAVVQATTTRAGRPRWSSGPPPSAAAPTTP